MGTQIASPPIALYLAVAVLFVIGIEILAYATYRRCESVAHESTFVQGTLRGSGNIAIESLVGDERLWNPAYSKSGSEYAVMWRQAVPSAKARLQRQGIHPCASVRNAAIVHLRCSDVPFNGHPEYPLLPRAYYEYVAGHIRASNVCRVIILNCTGHKTHPRAEIECPQIARKIAGWLRVALKDTERPIDIPDEPVCAPMRSSINQMLGCGLLISTGGSFSFVPGILKGTAFVTPSLCGKKEPNDPDTHAKVHWTMWPRFDFVHGSLYD
tara:strand:+ start:15099 stop:15905 length:807 start_codon:yes stop_codon:yes gene_type:complete